MDTNTYTCSFCDKFDAEVEVLLAIDHGGPCICNECIELANIVIAEERAKKKPKNG